VKQKTQFIAAAVAMVLLFVGGTLAYNAAKPAASEPISAANQAALVRAHSPTVGAAEAPVVIVEFLDPACETCATFYPMVKEMLAANPAGFASCCAGRPSTTVAGRRGHAGGGAPAGQILARPRSAARVAGRVGARPHAQVALAWKQLAGLGLNQEKLQADMASPEITQSIAQDLDDARALNVTMTPEYFVNGRPLPSFGYEQLKQLVDDALKQAR